jgi:hypothetical protein
MLSKEILALYRNLSWGYIALISPPHHQNYLILSEQYSYCQLILDPAYLQKKLHKIKFNRKKFGKTLNFNPFLFSL